MAIDPIDQAIAAAEEPERRVTVQVTLGNGRVIAINAPGDLVPIEKMALAHYLLGPQFDAKLAEGNGARAPRILVPAHLRT